MVTTVHYLNPEGHARVGFFFHALRWDGEPRNTEPHKCARIGWFPLDQLPHNTVPYSRAGVELYRRGEPFGLQGWPNPAEFEQPRDDLACADSDAAEQCQEISVFLT